MSSPDASLRELKVISKILLLTNAQAVKKEIEKICGSEARKKMWVLTDGTRMPKVIGDEAKVTAAAVSYFLNAGVAAGLIQYERGEPPRRLLEYVPPEWIQLTQGSEQTLESQQPSNAEGVHTGAKNGGEHDA